MIEGEELQGGILVDFTEIKGAAREICNELDERTLLPTLHPDLQIEEGDGYVEARYGDKTYRFPADDVKLLQMGNTSVEELARHFGESLIARLGDRLRGAGVQKLSVGIEETPGQSGMWLVSL